MERILLILGLYMTVWLSLGGPNHGVWLALLSIILTWVIIAVGCVVLLFIGIKAHDKWEKQRWKD